MELLDEVLDELEEVEGGGAVGPFVGVTALASLGLARDFFAPLREARWFLKPSSVRIAARILDTARWSFGRPPDAGPYSGMSMPSISSSVRKSLTLQENDEENVDRIHT